MNSRKLLIADSSDDFLLALTDALQQRYHVLCCRDGKRGLELLRSENCDMILLDLMLPELDGITLLEAAAAEDIHPTILAFTTLLNDYVYRSAQRLGISYLIRKPCDIRAICARVDDLFEGQPPKRDDRKLVSGLLLSLSLSTKHAGYNYLLECILSIAKEPGQPFTKVLYPAVGKRFGRSGSQVERSIRNALDVAWPLRDEALWQQYFPPSHRRPTAAEVITRLAEVLQQSWE